MGGLECESNFADWKRRVFLVHIFASFQASGISWWAYVWLCFDLSFTWTKQSPRPSESC